MFSIQLVYLQKMYHLKIELSNNLSNVSIKCIIKSIRPFKTRILVVCISMSL